ncbi:MAG TPA: hypothetical protein VJ625_14100 [Propionibacteriaceae bacterium]|nr:hypothetical protein [Propionibacteriaceae bacterium]
MAASDDLDTLQPAELAARAEQAVLALARSGDPEAFAHLLHLSRIVGESLGESARLLAANGSWSGVAGIAGTTRQAAWERWH